jgi:hypothetical protein
MKRSISSWEKRCFQVPPSDTKKVVLVIEVPSLKVL